jgi:hypothetical protein
MRGLRGVLIVDALVAAAGSAFSDRIVGSVVIVPALLIAVILSIALLGADLLAPRVRVRIVCSALSIFAPFPFLILGYPTGPRAGAAALVVLQVVPLVRGGPSQQSPAPTAAGVRRLLATLVITTALLLVTVLGLTWYGSTYLLGPSAAVFSRGPYLTRVTTSEADFAWTAEAGAGRVGLQVLAPNGRASAVVNGKVAGLRPDTRYVWTANIGGRSAASGAFRTAPTSTASPITLVSFGDYGSGNDHEYAVGRLAAAVDPALFLSAGDNAYLLAAPPFLDRAIFDPLRALLGEAPMVATLGEHDLAWDDGSAVISAFHLPGHQYSVQYGPVQVVVLGLQADPSALAYATKALGVCDRPCPVRFVLTHRPIGADNPIMPLLRRRHVAAILAGHLHRYERHVRAGVLEFTVGTGGEGPGNAANTRASPDALASFIAYGFLRIGISSARISYQFVDERGRVRDRVERRIAS